MIQELNITPSQALLLMTILIPCLFYLWHVEGAKMDDNTHEETELVETTSTTVSERYGAYIQLAGRRYN